MSLATAELDLRRGGITGTDIAAIMGCHPYRSKLDVYLDKLDLVEPVKESPAMRLGTDLEPVISQYYSEQTGEVLKKEGTSKHPELFWVVGSPDRLVCGKKKGVELKTASFRQSDKWGKPGTDEVPPHYLLQCAWYMALKGFPEWDIAMLPLGWTPLQGSPDNVHIYPLKRDEALEELLLAEAFKFWKEHVQAKTPPALDGSDRASEYLKKQHPRANDELVVANNELEELYALYNKLKDNAKAAAEEVAAIENRFKSIIGDKSGVAGDCWQITWKNNKYGLKTDWRQVAIEAGASQALIDKHSMPVDGARVFRIKEAK